MFARLEICVPMGAALRLVGFAQPTLTASPQRMGCSPQTLTPESTLTLSLPWIHSGRFEIKGPEPEEAYYTVIDYYHPQPPGFRPMISPKRFERMNSVSLKVREIVGDDQDPQKGRKVVRRSKRVFTVSGAYTLCIVAIDKERGYSFYTTVALCQVNYVEPNFKEVRPKRNFYSDLEDVAE